MPHAAPSRQSPTTATENEASSVLKLGEFTDVDCLNVSEARILLQRTLDIRKQRGTQVPEKEILLKTQQHLELFSAFKDLADANALEGIVKVYEDVLTGFELKALGSLVPSCADEAKTLIPSLIGKIADEDLEDLCRQLQNLKFQAQQR